MSTPPGGLERRFGVAVRAAREERGFTQEKLAEAADLNRSYLGEIERGLVAASLITVEKIAAALGLPPSTLLARSEYADSDSRR